VTSTTSQAASSLKQVDNRWEGALLLPHLCDLQQNELKGRADICKQFYAEDNEITTIIEVQISIANQGECEMPYQLMMTVDSKESRVRKV
jgi:hypothetical protein